MSRLLRMFPTTSSFFSTAKAPTKHENCTLINCFFNHTQKRSLSQTTEVQLKRSRTDPGASSFDKAADNLISAADKTTGDLKVWAPKALPGIGAPAKHQQRMRYISALIEAYTSNGFKTPKREAVDAEYKIAVSSNTNTYSFNITKLLKSARNNTKYDENTVKIALSKMSHDEQFDAVYALIHSKNKLNTNGYVTEVPVRTPKSANPLKKITCNRCQVEINSSEIVEKKTCSYHERRKRRTDTGVYWECCSELVGDSTGCKSSEHHVFKASSPLEMQELIPFTKTPDPKILSDPSKKKRIVGLDCEMGYTSKGLELIRLTVIDFYTGKTIFDEVVKPFGQVLDLNTQWSGVADIPSSSMTLTELYEVIFHTILDTDTIIIGHGLENDLNALRLVHYNVVDTAILFPKSLYHKYALKDLAFQMLDRKIQSGEHSSEEDSLAAIDIVKEHISK